MKKILQIQFKSWQRLMSVGKIIAVPVMAFWFFEPNVGEWTGVLKITSCVIIVSFGVFGALWAVLLKAGMVEFSFSEEDKQTLTYRMMKNFTETEKATWGSWFSSRYYDSFENKKKDSNDSKN